MGMDSRNEMEKSMLSPQAQHKFDELVALLAEERYGPDGPPIDTRFAEFEQFGHQAGRMLGRSLDERLTERHAGTVKGAGAYTEQNKRSGQDSGHASNRKNLA